jgi:hypothetical protein
MKTSAIYYTDSVLDPKIAEACRKQLRESFDGEIVSVSLKPLDFGDTRIVIDKPRGYGTMFQQILAALEASTSEVVFFCEHDVVYPKSHFYFTPPSKDKFYYDLNWWKVGKGDLAVHWDAAQVSGLVCYRDLATKFYASRVASFDPENFDRKFEPTVNTEFETWRAPEPHIDIRHQSNLTYNKWHIQHFRKKETAVNFQEATIQDIPGWDTGVIKSIIEI